MEIKTLILLGIFFIVVFFGIYLYCNTVKKCLKDSYTVEKFNKEIIKNALNKEFIDTGRESMMALYNSFKTNADRNRFLKGPNLGLTPDQIQNIIDTLKGPNLGLTPDQIQNIIDSLKADVTNKPTENGSASTQTYVQRICSAYNVLKPLIEKVPWELFIQIYGDAGGLSSDNPETRMNSEKAIGLDLLSFGLGAAGLGFLTGPLANLFGLAPKTPPPIPLEKVLANIVADQAKITAVTNFVGQQNAYFESVKKFIQDYSTLKYNEQILCPPPIGCQTMGSGSTKQCDPSAQNSATISCMNTPDIMHPSIPYDPNILYPRNSNNLDSEGNPTMTKREYLKSILTDASSNSLAALVTGTAPNVSINCGINAMMTMIPYGIGPAITFLPQYLIIISYTMAYYHELALLDETFPDPTLPSYDQGYYNPWMSPTIGLPISLYSGPIGKGQFKTQAVSQASGTLLGSLQQICAQFQSYIDTTFELYFNGLIVTTPQGRDNGCCPDSAMKCCSQSCEYCPPNCTPCSSWTIWRIQDTTNSASVQIIPNDITVPNNAGDWYGAMRTKYPNYTFYSTDTHEVKVDNTWNDGTALVVYMNCFREFLNFPYNHLIDYCKIAGYNVPSNITGDQLYYNTLNRLFPKKGYTNPQTYGIPVSIPFDLSNSTTFSYDLSGGYPFGLKAPSYRQAIQKYITPDQVVLPDSSSLLQDTLEFNTYCSPIINITPVQFFDATMFNIKGDDASTPWGNAACDIGNTGAVSCVKAGYSPGDSSNIIPSSRTAFCVDVSGSGSTYKARASPLLRGIPTHVDPSFVVTPITSFPAPITYTGTVERVQLPSNVTKINFYCWGAGGGGGGLATFPAVGGGGAFISGTISIDPGSILEIYVGQGGVANKGITNYGRTFGGGGSGGATPTRYPSNDWALYSASGGGYSSIGLYNGTLYGIVGGGGGCPSNSTAYGIGFPAISTPTSTSTQHAGGNVPFNGGDGKNSPDNINVGGGGGGGGYIGGIGGNATVGGNGGTSFIDPSVSNQQGQDAGEKRQNDQPGGISTPQYIKYGAPLGVAVGGASGFDINAPTKAPWYGKNGGNGLVIIDIAL